MHFQNRFSSFSKSVQDFLRKREVSNIGTHIKDVDMNSKCTYDSTTVLMMVCAYSHVYDPLRYSYHIPHAVKKVKWLLSKGADPNMQDEQGWTALMYAAKYSKHVKIYKGKCFMEKIEEYKIRPVEQKINRNLSLMIVNYFDKESYIWYKSSEKIVKILLTKGRADPNVQDKFGLTALMWSASNSSPERGSSSEKTVKILLKGGADPNKQNRYGTNVLIIAALNSSPERGRSSERTVVILLKGGADPNRQNRYGWTALMHAVHNSSPERGVISERTIKLLLDNGADPNKQDKDGRTALMYAYTPSVT